jgi:LPXTG-site transpeptidase (sortase) family protein
MRHHCWTIILVTLLLSACGGAPQAEQPTAAALSAPTAASAPAEGPTTEAQAIATTGGEAPTAELFRAEPTAPLILPPTATSAASAKPAATSAPAAVDSQPSTDPQSPSPTEQPAAKEEPGQPREPVRIVLDAVGIDFKIVSVGLDKNRVPIVPEHDVGWYNLSAQPGQGDNVVLWGHVLRFRNAPKIPAPFARLKEVKPGAKVVVYNQDGKAHNYVVTQQIWVKPNEVDYILPKGKEMITMVSCIGDKVITNGEVVDESHRLITIAEPVA